MAQAYDSSLKELFEGHAAEIIPYLFPGATFIGELNDEVLKPPLRADRVYMVDAGKIIAVAHVEMETKADAEMGYRLLEYFGNTRLIYLEARMLKDAAQRAYPSCTPTSRNSVSLMQSPFRQKKTMSIEYRDIGILWVYSTIERRISMIWSRN